MRLNLAAIRWWSFTLLCIALTLQRGWAQQVPVTEKTLSNGMRLLLVERHDDPSVSAGWVVHVGSANEHAGITGMAHLFEHMMFKGSPTIGITDHEKERRIMEEQERVRELMSREKAKMREAHRLGKLDDLRDPKNQTDRYRELNQKYTELLEKQRELMVKNEFSRIYTREGASHMNAFTTHDFTGYFITVPANKLKLWMWMESERLLRPVFREFYAERDVVLEERRMRIESTPLGKFEESLEAMFWTSHPYSWPVIGWPSDIANLPKEEARRFFDLYYAPQNITLILVGDLQPDEAEAMAESYFSRIPKGDQPVPEVITREIEQPAEKRMLAEADANPQVDILWHTVPFQHEDSYALEVLAQLLSTRTGRLYKGLVMGKEVATDVFARQDSRRWAGLFNAGGEVKSGYAPEDVEQAIYDELEQLKSEPVPEKELQKVKNNFAAQEYRRLSSNFQILIQLLFYEGRGDWREINQAGPRIQEVTAEQVRQVAQEYFTPENRTVAIYTRKPGTEGEEAPELAGLTQQQKNALRAVEAKLQQANNPEKLRQALQQLEQQMPQAGEDQQAFLKLYRQKIQERLDTLQGESDPEQEPDQDQVQDKDEG